MNVNVEASARSDVGTVRKVNEDSFVARTPAFLVADGMGGHARGDKASQAAVRVIGEFLPADYDPSPDEVVAAVHAANDAVRALSTVDDSGVAVAGTTLTGVVQVHAVDDDEPRWMVVNVGDSRVYGWDGRTLGQLTVDHSAVQELLDAGAISVGESLIHPERNVITRALGADDTVEVDVWLLPVTGNQTFLICSDGLCKELDDEAIAMILADTGAGHADAASRADALVEAALEAGGRDNVTVIVVESLAGDVAEDPDSTRDRPATAHEFLEDTRPRG